MSVAALVGLALSPLVTGLSVHLCARQWAPRRLFLIALDRDLDAEDRARSRRLMAANAVLTAVSLSLVWLAPWRPVALLASSLLPLLSVMLLVREMLRTGRSAEARPDRFAVPLDEPPGLLAYLSPPLQLLHFALLWLGVGLFVRLSTGLAGAVPLHWNARGQVDRFGSPAELWLFGGIMSFGWLLTLVLALGVARERWALPERERERYVELQRERRRLLVRLVEVLMLGVNAAVAVMWLSVSIGSRSGHESAIAPGLVAGSLLLAVGALLPLALFLPKLVRVQDGIRAIAGTDVLGTHAAGWRWGGMVYYAPHDPALFIPKRVGIGQTLNFGRPGAWLFLVSLVVAPVLIAVLVQLLSAG